MSPTRRLPTSGAIALVGVVFLGLGLLRAAMDSPRSPWLGLGFGVLFVALGLAGVARERRGRRR